jgi:hypothetical protein
MHFGTMCWGRAPAPSPREGCLKHPQTTALTQTFLLGSMKLRDCQGVCLFAANWRGARAFHADRRLQTIGQADRRESGCRSRSTVGQAAQFFASITSFPLSPSPGTAVGCSQRPRGGPYSGSGCRPEASPHDNFASSPKACRGGGSLSIVWTTS